MGLGREGLETRFLPVRGAREEEEGEEEGEAEEEEAREDEPKVEIRNPAFSLSVSDEVDEGEDEDEGGREVPAPGTMLAMGHISSDAWWRSARGGWGVRNSCEGTCPKS